MKKAVLVLTILIFLGYGGTLLADPVLLDLVSVSPQQTVQISAPGIPYTGGANAGVHNLAIDFSPSDGFNNPQSFAGYCVEGQFTYDGGAILYDIVPIPVDDADLQQAAWIFVNYGTPSDPLLAATYQAAIWIVIDGITVSTSNSVYPAANFIAGLAADAVLNNDWTAPSGVSLAVHPVLGGDLQVAVATEDYQNFIIRTPEPASILLLGLGLFGVGLVGRKYC